MLARALAVFVAIVAVEMLHGVLRTMFLLPQVGDLVSRRIGVFTGSLLILAIALATVRWIGARTRGTLLAIGLAWSLLMVAFEMALGRLGFGLSWQRIGEDFDLVHGGLLPLGIVVLALSPLVAARIRGIS